ncbi:HAMP domain-containing histidine kinase [Clostridioides difficile]|nr:HAMP domain-containing histidine kinase [Clostridioides difficile]MCO9000824.1 HAMP domain-containing histidine kinase [Clostridioides difficile]HDX7135286.1 HAMP domain-containing histidine kinase [Clostridioides difficile]HDX7147370.1 HAMP domain-containing histidine kinase [Clostridioides difficile]
MHNFGKFISKQFFIYLSVVILIVVLDLVIFFLTFNGTVSNMSKDNPVQTLEKVSNNLTIQNGEYKLNNNYQKDLVINDIWGIVIDDNGNVVWKHNLPKEIPLNYSLQDVATFSKGYIKDYPVFAWKQGNDLLVLGYPKNSYSKFMTNYLPLSAIQKTPFLLLIMLVSNIAILFIVYYLSKRNVMLKISPILNGIDKLSHGDTVTLNINGELEEIGNRINETSLQLKKQNQARANWISGVSHDIRTPLSMIMGYADKISSTLNIDENTKKQANIIKTQSIKIKNLVQDLNLVSQLNYNIQPIQETPIHLCKIIREIVVEYLNNNTNNKFEFELNLKPNTELITIIGDERLLGRAIQNIISNSINHNENGCIISISLEVNGSNLILVISDNGKGISEEKLQKIQSTPHYLQSTDDRLDLRHGLGLLLVKEIVSIHKGNVSISSALNKGFSTTISLPIKNQ